MSDMIQTGDALQGRALLESILIFKIHAVMKETQRIGKVDDLDLPEVTDEQLGLYVTAVYQVLTNTLTDEQKRVAINTDCLACLPMDGQVNLKIGEDGQFYQTRRAED